MLFVNICSLNLNDRVCGCTFSALFKDEGMKQTIMSTDDPVKQKKFGRQVQNFEKDVWNKAAEEVVKTASKAKVGYR